MNFTTKIITRKNNFVKITKLRENIKKYSILKKGEENVQR